MKMVFKGKELFEKSGVSNIHQLSLQARISAQTAYKYLATPEDVKSVDMGVLFSILVDGMGMSPEQILKMKVEDLFELK